MPKTLAFLISGRGSNMCAILDAIDRGEIRARPGLVISSRDDAAGLKAAADRGIPTKVISPQRFDSREAFETALCRALEQIAPDLVVLAGFMHILGAATVRRFEGKVMNIHPALLPKYKGLHTHRRVLEAREPFHGCSVHFVTEQLDAGPLIMQAKVPVYPDDSEKTLAARVLEQEHIIYPESVKLYCENKLHIDN